MMTESIVPNLRDLRVALSRPFPLSAIDIKPGALTKDRCRGLALAYGDPRTYMERLDELFGPEGWHVAYTVLPHGVVCRLTLLGVTKADVGDFPLDASDSNQLTSAAMQAFKRACALFGLGRYLYHLPQVWADYDDDKRAFVDPAGVLRRIYTLAGLTADGSVRLDHSAAADETNSDGIPSGDAPADHTDPATPAPARRVAPATRQASARPATPRQVQLLRNRSMAGVAQERYGVTRLEDLSFAQASALIGELPLRATRA